MTDRARILYIGCIAWVLAACRAAAPSSAVRALPREVPSNTPVVLYGPVGTTPITDPNTRNYPHGNLCPDLAVDGDENVFVSEVNTMMDEERIDGELKRGSYVGRLRATGGLQWMRWLTGIDGGFSAIGASPRLPGFSFAATTDTDMDLGTLHVAPGPFVIAFDAEGNPRWSKPLPEKANVMRVLVGPTGDTTVLADDYAGNVWIGRWDVAGNPKWTKRVPGALPEMMFRQPGDLGYGGQYGALFGDDLYLWYQPWNDGKFSRDAVLVRFDGRGDERWRITPIEITPVQCGGPKECTGELCRCWPVSPRLAVDSQGALYAYGVYQGEIWVRNGGGFEWWPYASGYGGLGGILLRISPGGTVDFAEDFEANRHGIYASGLAVDAQDRPWITGEFLWFVGFSRERSLLAPVFPDRNGRRQYTIFLASFDAAGKARDAKLLAFGGVQSIAAGRRDALYITTRYIGEFLLPGTNIAPLKNFFRCVVLKLPTRG